MVEEGESAFVAPSDLSSETSINTLNWNLFGKRVPKREIVFFCQVILIYIVVITCIVNLTIGTDNKSQLWTALLSACLGYLLPNPTLNDETIKHKKIIIRK